MMVLHVDSKFSGRKVTKIRTETHSTPCKVYVRHQEVAAYQHISNRCWVMTATFGEVSGRSSQNKVPRVGYSPGGHGPQHYSDGLG